jgi:hypothetical protein
VSDSEHHLRLAFVGMNHECHDSLALFSFTKQVSWVAEQYRVLLTAHTEGLHAFPLVQPTTELGESNGDDHALRSRPFVMDCEIMK